MRDFAQRKPAGSESAPADGTKQRVTQFLKDVGAPKPIYLTEPVALNQFFIDSTIEIGDPVHRALAWLKSKTAALNIWSAYAVDEKNRELTVRDMARDLGWTEVWARKVWRRMVELGLGRVDPHRTSRLYLGCGKPAGVDQGNPVKKSCTEFPSPSVLHQVIDFTIPKYVKRQIGKLPQDSQEAAIAELKRAHDLKVRVRRESQAALRAWEQEYDDNLYDRLGFDRRTHEKPKRPPTGVRLEIKLDLQGNLFEDPSAPENPAPENPVQNFQNPVQVISYGVLTDPVQDFQNTVQDLATEGELVQCERDSSSGAQDVIKPLILSNNGGETSSSSVISESGADGGSRDNDDDDSYLPEKSLQTQNPTPKPTPADLKPIVQTLAKFCHPDDAGCRQILRDCRKNAPDCTPEEIARVIESKRPLIQQARSPMGMAIRSVPKCFEPTALAELRRQWADQADPTLPESVEARHDAYAKRMMKAWGMEE